MALADNLLRYFKMDDNAANTTVVDSTGNANGTNAANTSGKTNTGKINSALVFNGSSDSVNLGSGISINGNDPFTFNLWVYPTASSNGNVLTISPDGSNNLQIQTYIAAGALYYQRGGQYVEKIVTLSLNTWVMLTITYDGTNIRGYRNATEESTSPVASAGSISAGTNNARIARAANAANGYFTGRIDMVGIWSRALSGAEITSLYNGGTGLDYPFGTNVTVTPSAQVVTSSVPSRTISTGTKSSPSAQVSTFSVPAYSVKIAEVLQVNAQVATFSVPAYLIEAGDVLVLPSAQVATFSIPAYSVKYGLTLFPNAQVDTFSIPAYTVAISEIITVSPQVANFTIPAYAISLGLKVSPSAQVGTFSLPAYTVTGETRVHPSAQAATFSVPVYSLSLGISIPVSTQVLTFSIPTLFKFGAIWEKVPRSTNSTWSRSSRNST